MGVDIWDIEGSHNLASILGQAKQLCMMRIMQPWLLNEWLWKLHPKSGQLNYISSLLHQFTSKVIAVRKQEIGTSNKQKDDDKCDNPENSTLSNKLKIIIILKKT